jgi:hypothetical protein
MKGRGSDGPKTGSQTLRLNLHQTFATPDGLILLGFSLVVRLTVSETACETLPNKEVCPHDQDRILARDTPLNACSAAPVREGNAGFTSDYGK